MLIELSKLDEIKGSFSHVYSPSELGWVDDRIRLTGPVSVVGRVRRSGVEVAVEGKIESAIEVDCDRCLKAIQIPVNTDFVVEYFSKYDYESNQSAELSEEEMSFSIFEGDSIDVDEIVREQILLFVPVRVLCVENCKGICATCGADLNAGNCGCVTQEVDPRWAALKDLRKTD